MKKSPMRVSRETLSDRLQAASASMDSGLTQSEQNALLDYLDLLVKWNAVYNLTAIRDPLDMLTLHILDSLAVQKPLRQLFAERPSVGLMDLGAGAGLPGLVLAILNPTWQITLVDAVQKKVAFMTQAAGQLKLSNAKAVHGRVEQLQLQPFDGVISRAFSDLDLFVQLALPHLKPDGFLLAMQGKADARTVAPFSGNTLIELQVPGLNADRHLLVLNRLKD